MVQYEINPYQTSRNRIEVKAYFPCEGATLRVHMAAWRPGRYEEGNFTRLITHFQAFDAHQQKRKFRKTGRNSWEIETEGTASITITYLYMGNILNAGNSYLDDNLLLINPVNILIYNDISFKDGIQLKVNSPWPLVSASPHNDGVFAFSSFDAMFDTPILSSAEILTHEYEVEGCMFYLHLNAMQDVVKDSLAEDFRSFTRAQFLDFKAFPTNEFHFIVLGLPYPYLHGVEHLNSTVIVLGPNKRYLDSQYFRLLSVASHELYHTWNIKTIRPQEMLPYRFQEPNYSSLGWVYEGITTYMGDYYLLKAGLIDSSSFLTILSQLIQTHVDNPGRFSMSLCDSSVDTWVDGYVLGTPGRKVSIYNEGALFAFMLDMQIRQSTQHKMTLSTFMFTMYIEFAVKGLGYSERDILELLKSMCSKDFTEFFDRFLHQANGYESGLSAALEFLGLEITMKPSESVFEATSGIRVKTHHAPYLIDTLAVGGPGMTGGFCEGDEILEINGAPFTRVKSEEIASNSEIVDVQLTIKRNAHLHTKTLPRVQNTFFPQVELVVLATNNKSILKNRKIFGFNI